MKTVKFILIIIFLFGIYGVNAQKNNSKPRVIAMTDGEIDDQSSMIRFLLYTCDIELLGIIETNSCFQRNGHSKEDWYDNQLKAYKEVYPNLIIHNPDYPTYEKLKSLSFVGDEDIKHLEKTGNWGMRPGEEVKIHPDNWEDTPGSDRIVEVLLDKNPAPVYIQAWGGGNTAARAFCKIKNKYPDEYDRALSKVVMYNVNYQDGAGSYIEQNHPKVTMIYCGGFRGTWDYNSLKNTYDYIAENVKNNHGPLGALYPQGYVSEGDTPAFLYSIANGLRNYEAPGYGGWGGRFKKLDNLENVYIDASDDGDEKKSLRRWIDDANRNFQARMDWCVAHDYKDANHIPIIILKGKNNITVKSGEKIKLKACKSYDPDGDSIKFNWWQYKEAGTYDGLVKLQNSKDAILYFEAPDVSKTKTIHIILQVTDNGNPVLDSYERIIVTIMPQ